MSNPKTPMNSAENGNTIILSSGDDDTLKGSACIKWDFTLFKENCKGQLIQMLQYISRKWCFQQERCPTTERIHYQGALWLPVKGKQYKSCLLNKMKPWFEDISIRPMRNEGATMAYIQKGETRVAGPWSDGIPIIADVYTGSDLPKSLYSWQEELLEILDGPVCDRTIYWLWEPEGNVGKSKFAKWLSFHRGACKVAGKKSDIFHKAKAGYKIFIIDIPRTVEDRVPYEAIEELKNGHIFSGKYESDEYLFNPPHVVCFANFAPREQAMSLDRWVVKDASFFE